MQRQNPVDTDSGLMNKLMPRGCQKGCSPHPQMVLYQLKKKRTTTKYASLPHTIDKNKLKVDFTSTSEQGLM